MFFPWFWLTISLSCRSDHFIQLVLSGVENENRWWWVGVTLQMYKLKHFPIPNSIRTDFWWKMFTKIHCIPSYRLNLILVEIQNRLVRLVNHLNKKSIRLYFLSYIKYIISRHMINHMVQFYGSSGNSLVFWRFCWLQQVNIE